MKKKILVLYDSNTGHTEKMAELIGLGASSEDAQIRLRHVISAVPEDLIWCSGLALGSPVNYGTVSWRMKEWWDKLPSDLWGTINGKTACSFSSSGGRGGGMELTCLTLLTILMNYGFSVFGVTEYISGRYTLHYGAVVAGEPRSETEINACKALGRELVNRISKH